MSTTTTSSENLDRSSDLAGAPGHGAASPSPPPSSPVAVPFGRLLGYFLRLGTLGWGGPIAVIGYMQRDLVETRGWIDEQDFLDGVALGQTMPGPLAAQVAMWVGYLKRGSAGALAVAAAFIAPSFLMVFAVAAAYVHYSGLSAVRSVFHGISPVVVGIMAVTAYKLLKITDRRDLRAWAISAVVFVVTVVTGSEPVSLIVAAGVLMILLDARPGPGWWRRLPARRRGIPARIPARTPPRLPSLAAPLLSLGPVATGGKLVSLGLFFLKAGAVTFGFGLAIVPVMRDGVVIHNHWLTVPQFVDAVGIGLATPGPAVISATFIGYLVAGPVGAMVATVAVFTPIYLGVVVPGRWFVRYRHNPQVRAFVVGATAAAAGALAGVVVGLPTEFNLHTVGQEVGLAVMALTTIALLWRFRKLNELYLVLAGALFGLVALH